MWRVFVPVAVLAAALGVSTRLFLDEPDAEAPAINGYVLARPRPLPSVDLIDERGEPFPAARFAGHWSFLFFGYTYCPDICPLTLVELAAAKQALAATPEPQQAVYYLISVDPQRDTPERLGEYVKYFDPEFRGLTGSEQALAAIAQATETVFDVPAGQDPRNYLVSHSSNVVLLNPLGEVHAILTPPHDPATIAADFTALSRAAAP